MRIVDYQGIKLRQRRRAKKRKLVRRGFIVLVVAVFSMTYGYISFQLPLPLAQASTREISTDSSQQTNLVWPAYGQAALGNPEYGLLEVNGQQEAAPTASVAKIMTALAVLRKKPIVAGESIPRIRIDEADVASYNYYLNNDGSHVRVELGQELTEYQALQALLLPSANNIAETLARWAFGSVDAYVTYANDLARSLGMKNSYFAEPSGFSSRTVSTAQDLVLLGLAALNEPTIVDIMAQTTAILPAAGEIRNTNRVLGQAGIVGMKTGNTDEAGGCFMAAGITTKGGRKITTVAVIMGAPTVGRAMNDSVPLIASAYENYQEIPVLRANQQVADYTFSWGARNTAYVKDDQTILSWRGSDISVSLRTEPIDADKAAGTMAGTALLSSPLQKKSVPLYIQTSSSLPDVSWRLKRVVGL
jgi:D-alanyl-D-alanine carboxypeptidase (penicillin-binding protein 5/6)